MKLTHFLKLLDDPASKVEFGDSIALIDSLYQFTPTAFRNGNAQSTAEQNHGSCKILSFGQIQQLNQQQTLRCFGAFYRGVIDSPDGDDHQNIRQFMLHGWRGVIFDANALAPVNLSPAATEAN